MKKITSTLFLLVIVTSLIIGCTPDNPPPNPPANNTVAVSWQATINGLSYSYSDNYVNLEPQNANSNNEGGSAYGIPSIMLTKGGPYTTGDDVNIAIQYSEYFNLGTYNIITNGAVQMAVSVNGLTVGHSFFPNTSVTLNITEVPTAPGGLIKGNFSGVIGSSSSGGQTIPISGQFQSCRVY